MPLYEYQCKSCHTKTERIQKFSDPPLTVCPHCGGEMEQLLSAPAAHFKGAGWYVTDYARKGSGAPKDGKNTGDSSAKASGDAGGSSSGSSNSETSKPESSAKSENK